MKRFLLILLILLLLVSSSVADVIVNPSGELTITPGKYEIGVDIPAGYYDIRIKELDKYCIIRNASKLKDDGSLDIDSLYGYEFIFNSPKDYWQGFHPNILTINMCYLEILGSTCTFYPISNREF